MTSFQKVSENTCLAGTKIKNNLCIISTGICSLDHIIGGGLPSGSIFVTEEDVLGNYSRVLNKYFLAEGVVCNHDLFVASADENPYDIIKELPQPSAISLDDTESKIIKESDEMKIAWRYEGLSQVESSFGSNTNFGHHFDLSKQIDNDTLKTIDITYWSAENINENNSGGFQNSLYYDLLTNLKKVVCNEKYQRDQNKNILRVSIHSLGSPIWLAKDDDDSDVYGKDMIKFLYCLRILLRDTNAVAYISMPTHLFDSNSLFKRLLYSIDNAVRIESFAGSDRETNPVFKDYHGLFHITKLSAVNSLAAFIPPSLDLAFKLRRKKFIIEKLHLPPELQESTEREQDDITASTCGGFKKKDIDF